MSILSHHRDQAPSEAAEAPEASEPPKAAKLAIGDLLSEAIFAVGARPGRLVLTVLGTVLGIASVVVTIGLAQTMAAQVNNDSMPWWPPRWSCRRHRPPRTPRSPNSPPPPRSRGMPRNA